MKGRRPRPRASHMLHVPSMSHSQATEVVLGAGVVGAGVVGAGVGAGDGADDGAGDGADEVVGDPVAITMVMGSLHALVIAMMPKCLRFRGQRKKIRQPSACLIEMVMDSEIRM